MKTTKKTYKEMSVDIGNLTWKVYLCDKRNRNLYDKDKITAKAQTNVNPDECAYGITHFEVSEIYIRKDVNPQLIKRIIIHELTHAFLFSYGVMGNDSEIEEERLCSFNEQHLEEIFHMTNNICEEFGINY